MSETQTSRATPRAIPVDGRTGAIVRRTLVIVAIAAVSAGTTAALVTTSADEQPPSAMAPATAAPADVAVPSTAPVTTQTDAPSGDAALSPADQQKVLEGLSSSGGVGGGGGGSRADDRRAATPDRRRGGGGGGGPGRMGPGGFGPGGGGGQGGGGGRQPPPTTQERAEAIDFIRQHSPNRASFIERQWLPGPARQRMAVMMINTYRNLQKAKEQDPEVYDLMLKRLELEDKLFERDFRRSLLSGSSDAKAELRSKALDIVRLSLREREKRIERLERALEVEKKNLAADKANPDALVDGHARRMETQLRELTNRMLERRNNSGGGPPPNAAPIAPRSAVDAADDPDGSELAMADMDLMTFFDLMATTPLPAPAPASK
jgi:hypothetical protein